MLGIQDESLLNTPKEFYAKLMILLKNLVCNFLTEVTILVLFLSTYLTHQIKISL